MELGMYGYIYKISNSINNKVYIGQTTRTINIRFTEHIKKHTAAKRKHLKLYQAMQELGAENFFVEQLDCAESLNDLNYKERYWIKYYNSIKNGYNMLPGGNDETPMHDSTVKAAHDSRMRSSVVRAKISKTLSEYRTTFGFSESHKQKIKQARERRKQIRRELGLNFYNNPEHMASRSKPVYCILDTGERFDFKNILEAGRWWFNTFKPFGEIYSTATYQRKIESSAAGKLITFGNKSTKVYKEITNISWFYSQQDKKGGDAIYE